MKAKNFLRSLMVRRFSSAIALMRAMWIFIRVESSMIWQLMKLVSGQKVCLESYLVQTAPVGPRLNPEQYLPEIPVGLVMDGSNVFLSRSASMKESALRII